LPLEDFSTLLQEKGKGWFKNSKSLAKAIKRAIAQESIDVVLSVLVREIRARVKYKRLG